MNPYLEPQGYRQHASGLMVPERVSRAREVWTRDEMKLIDRVTKLLKTRGVKFLFKCDAPDCSDRAIVRADSGTGAILECGCKTRVFTRAF